MSQFRIFLIFVGNKRGYSIWGIEARDKEKILGIKS
jgi:hypothetical protein